MAEAALVGLGQGLARQGKTLADIAGSDAALAKPLQAKRDEALSIAGQADAGDTSRTLAIELIGVLPDAAKALVMVAQQEAPLPVRQRAIATLARQADLEPWKELLATFSSQSPPLRQSILDGVLSNAARTGLLLDLMQAGQIKPTELDVTQQNRLLATSDAEMRKRATAILGNSIGEDRKKALADYQPVLAMMGDARKGQAVFAKNCSACHKIGSVGVNVAPDISDSRTKTPAQLLGDILQPNRAIDANYIAYTLVTTDGITASGILTTETSTSITLKMQNEKVMTVPRSEIEVLKSTGVSLMPEGLERNIPPAEMADLIAFIKNWRYLTGEIPGLGK
ncbi:MAG: c-type cytochrome [Pirellulales bacterium]